MISTRKLYELRQNYDAFMRVLPTLIDDHEGQHVLMRHGEVVDYFDSVRDALTQAGTEFDDDLFSIQEVTSAVADLGWYSRATANPPL